MANLPNLYAEIGADYIGDDAQPALHIANTGTGPGLRVRGLVNTSTASIDIVNTPQISQSAAGAGVLVTRTVVGNISIGVLRVQGNSLASGAMLEFTGNRAFASITSVVLTTVANTDYAIRVQVGNELRWIVLFKDAAIVGAAVPEA